MAVPERFAGHRLAELGGHVFISLRRETVSHATDAPEHRDSESGLLDSKAFVDGVCQQLRDLPPTGGKSPQLSLIRFSGLGDLAGDPSAAESLLRNLGGTLRAFSSNGDLALRVGHDQFGLLHEPDVDLAELRQELLGLLPGKAGNSAAGTIETASIALVVDHLHSEEVAKGIVAVINRFRAREDPAAALSGAATGFPALAKQAVRTIEQLKTVIANGGFNLIFQPIIDALHGKIHHYEALVRFPAACGMQSTFECVALAEEIGAVEELDIGIAQKVVDWLHGTKASVGAACAVNISGQSVTSSVYSERLLQLLDAHPGLHSRMLFEITESSRIRDLAAANAFVHLLSERGYAVCLDDFGAGAANFPYLAGLDVDIVKFDGPAVRIARLSAKGIAFLKALSSVCRELGIRTVFEMIDDEEGLNFARGCGADYVQGYLFGEPSANIEVFRRSIPAELFRTLLAL
jgi:EAL domain-containing protein (putative c-di-GMP-specific phosphodiesterase class I)